MMRTSAGLVVSFSILASSVSTLSAAPTVSVLHLGINPGGNRVWSVRVAPDATYFVSRPSGLGGSLAVELAFSISGSGLANVAVNPVAWDHANPGNNPLGGVSTGLVVGGAGGSSIAPAGGASLLPPPNVPGDYNFNGIVDAADYVVWRDELGSAGLGVPGDGNLNGIVDESDYELWAANFGSFSAASLDSGSAALGESATIFAAFGSTFLTNASPVELLRIETQGTGPAAVAWHGAYSGHGRVAQAGLNFDIYGGSVAVIPEPTATALVLFAGFASPLLCRPRHSLL